MESYRKAADGGNCLAMMAIGDLYAKGNGVRADQAQVQSWHDRAQSCQGGNIAMLQQQVAQYKARAVAARDPALYPVLAALPDIPKLPAQAPRNNPRSPALARNADSSGFNQSIIDGLVSAAVIVIALDLLVPNSPPGNADSCCADPGFATLRNIMQTNRAMACAGSGGTLSQNGFVCN